jgi:hypothetical protein
MGFPNSAPAKRMRDNLAPAVIRPDILLNHKNAECARRRAAYTRGDAQGTRDQPRGSRYGCFLRRINQRGCRLLGMGYRTVAVMTHKSGDAFF